MLQYIKNLFKKKYHLTFHMKSGAKIKAKVTEYEFDKTGNELRSYSLTWPNKKNILYIRLEDVSAITKEN